MGQSMVRSTQAVTNSAPACAPHAQKLSSHVTLGAGCYWGTEKYVRKDFQKKFPNSVKSATVGFMSANASAQKNPSYAAVCSGATGHVEVLEVELNDPQKVRSVWRVPAPFAACTGCREVLCGFGGRCRQLGCSIYHSACFLNRFRVLSLL